VHYVKWSTSCCTGNPCRLLRQAQPLGHRAIIAQDRPQHRPGRARHGTVSLPVRLPRGVLPGGCTQVSFTLTHVLTLSSLTRANVRPRPSSSDLVPSSAGSRSGHHRFSCRRRRTSSSSSLASWAIRGRSFRARGHLSLIPAVRALVRYIARRARHLVQDYVRTRGPRGRSSAVVWATCSATSRVRSIVTTARLSACRPGRRRQSDRCGLNYRSMGSRSTRPRSTTTYECLRGFTVLPRSRRCPGERWPTSLRDSGPEGEVLMSEAQAHAATDGARVVPRASRAACSSAPVKCFPENQLALAASASSSSILLVLLRGRSSP